MTIRIIEALTQGTDVWTPIIVGNASGTNGVRYISVLPRADAKNQTPTFRTLNFNKDGGAAESETARNQRRNENSSPQLHKLCRAMGAQFADRGWGVGGIDRMSLRAVNFGSHTELNKYLLARQIKPVISGTEATEVTEVVIPQGEQTVAELYQTLGKMIATNPKSGIAKAIIVQPLNDLKLSDDQILLLQRNIQSSLIKNAADNIAKQLESKANADIAKLYSEFGVKNPPKIKLFSLVEVSLPKAKK